MSYKIKCEDKKFPAWIILDYNIANFQMFVSSKGIANQNRNDYKF